MQLTASTTIRRSPQEVYGYWRQVQNFPEFMAHVDDITVLSDIKSHWKVSGPFDTAMEWDAEIIQDDPGEALAWRSVEGADIDNAGSVTFAKAPGDQGTEVRVSLSYDSPGGKAGELIARLAGEDPRQQLDDDLRRFKQVMETGEIVRSDGAPWGKRARKEFPQHPAQPLSAYELAEVNA
jgi:uncharacterized membrane protein